MLTGKYYHKKTFLGMVLMVEEEITVSDFVIDGPLTKKVWRKAKELEVKTLNL